jgi:vacuolar-type H+-ATPase subunit C/Vma6
MKSIPGLNKTENMKHHDINTHTIVNDEMKLKVIFTIDKLSRHFTGTIYASELRGLRRKYIYKDISLLQLKLDVDWLKNLIKLSKSQ